MPEFNVCNIIDQGQRVSIIPDFYKVLTQKVEPGDTVIVPLIKRNNEICMWETGGRKRATNNTQSTSSKRSGNTQNATSSFATIIASNNDNILNAILFDKVDKRPNNRQALLSLKPDFHVYVGRMSIKRGVLAPSIKVIRLIFKHDSDELNADFKYGDYYRLGMFEIDKVFTDYTSIEGIIPAERLVSKLYTFDVIRPFFANGWNISNQPQLPENVEPIRQNVRRLIDIKDEDYEPDPNKFIDMIEDEITSLKSRKLSSVFHQINFETGMMRIVILKDLDMKNVKGTIDSATALKSFTISLEDIKRCYNPNIIFRSDDMKMLEVALTHDTSFSTKINNREHVFLRAWRG